MEKSPVLTVAIPAYNVAHTLKKALSSFDGFSKKDLEILLINDGSTDNTLNIAKAAVKANPCIKLIDKPNGGHGSVINTAIKNATGKYFRLLDGDDWFDAKNLIFFLKKLKNETSDLVLTEHYEVFKKTHTIKLSNDYSNIKANVKINIENVNFKKYGPTLPNATIKTRLLKKSNFHIDEHCFYVDQEYNFILYVFSNTFIKYDLPIYYYLLEQDNQSMSHSNLKKNVLSHETVCIRLIKETSNIKSTKKIDHLYKNIISPLCNLQYEIILNYCHSKKLFLSFDQKLSQYPLYYNSPFVAGSIIKLHRKTNGLSIPFNNLLNQLAHILKSLK